MIFDFVNSHSEVLILQLLLEFCKFPRKKSSWRSFLITSQATDFIKTSLPYVIVLGKFTES